MKSTLSRMVRIAGLTLAGALPMLLPGTIHAEDEASILGSFLHGCEETVIDDGVVASGKVVHSNRINGGWGIEVTFTNGSDARHTVRASVVLQKAFFNPAGRVSSTPADAWAVPASVDLAPHASVTRVFALPASIASEMDSSNTLAHAKSLAVERAQARGQEPPSWAWGIEGSPRRHFDVAIRAPAAAKKV
jgi:hypothetical protein